MTNNKSIAIADKIISLAPDIKDIKNSVGEYFPHLQNQDPDIYWLANVANVIYQDLSGFPVVKSIAPHGADWICADESTVELSLSELHACLLLSVISCLPSLLDASVFSSDAYFDFKSFPHIFKCLD